MKTLFLIPFFFFMLPQDAGKADRQIDNTVILQQIENDLDSITVDLKNLNEIK